MFVYVLAADNLIRAGLSALLEGQINFQIDKPRNNKTKFCTEVMELKQELIEQVGAVLLVLSTWRCSVRILADQPDILRFS
jgi:hypothetical protein